MGVRGLTTYINNNQDVFLKKHYLHDCSLVIDGLSLCSQLYIAQNSFSAFGGDYDKIASYVKTFFKNLRKCKVTPYIIFDGCHEKRKLKTVFSRLKSKLFGVSQLDPVKQRNLKIFPFLLRDIFKEVLVEMKIAFTVCDFEADYEIAALARYLNCPVLSYDSDFFIYNVLYIPFNLLETTPKPIEVSGNKVTAMECKLFKVQYLCEHRGIQEELLPLLATLLGNDFVEKRVFNKFFAQLKKPKRGQKNEQQRNIHALFNWLQNETLDSAIAKILGRLKKYQKNKVFEIIKKSVDGYHSKHCTSFKYFDIHAEEPVVKSDLKMPEITDEDIDSDSGENNSEDASDEEVNQEEENMIVDTTDSNLESLPDWFVEKVRKNLIPTVYLNLYAHHLHICNPQPEDFTEEDSFHCVLHIIRYAFDILTDFSHDNCVYISRVNTNYTKLLIDKEYAVGRPLQVSYKDLTDPQLQNFFKHFLDLKLKNLDYTAIKLLPSSFQLFMISMLWWISKCQVPTAHAHSLIMSYIMFEVIDEKTGTARGHYYFNSRHATKLSELRGRPTSSIETKELVLNKNKVQYEDCLVAASTLLKLFEIDDSILKRPRSYDRKKIHSFAQFQCSLHQINSLNILCCSPFDTTVYSKSYNGTFIYNITLKLENQVDPMSYLEQYLKGAPTVIQFYRSICKIYNKLLEKMELSTVPWSSKRKRST